MQDGGKPDQTHGETDSVKKNPLVYQRPDLIGALSAPGLFKQHRVDWIHIRDREDCPEHGKAGRCDEQRSPMSRQVPSRYQSR